MILEAKVGARIALETGMMEYGFTDRMTTLHFYKAEAGSCLHLLDLNYEYAVATYSLHVDPIYMYQYCYQPEENWTTYNHDLFPYSYVQGNYLFEHRVYFRICLKRKDGGILMEQEAENINTILSYTTTNPMDHGNTTVERDDYEEEIRQTVETIQKKRKEKSVVLGVLTDSHYTVNGTWEDTAYTMRRVNQQVKWDGIVHLGDLTDGMVTEKVTKDYVGNMMQDLKENQVPLYMVLGNHDSNYFHNNKEPFTMEEQCQIYQSNGGGRVRQQPDCPYYYVDYERSMLRCLFLSSFDYKETVRYGFPNEELDWLELTLGNTPKGYGVVIFSHLPPMARLDYWSDQIRNEVRILAILEQYQNKEHTNLMAYIHGHTHADYLYAERTFPIISIGCAKCESFPDKKPKGATVWNRVLHTVTQELWDTVIITPEEKQIDFVRFGAGADRSIQGNWNAQGNWKVWREAGDIRLGMIGTGRIANRFVPEARGVNGMTLYGVYNPHDNSGTNFARRHGIPFVTDQEETLYEQVDAVYIATPHDTHYAYIKHALEHGKHVLCEKPMVLTKAQAEKVFQLAQQKGCVLMEGIKTAYAPGFAQVLEVIKSGRIGEIRDVEACFTKLADPACRELTDEKTGGSFLELGSYPMLGILRLLGIHYQELRFESFLGAHGVDIYTKAYLKYPHSFATAKVGLGVKSQGQLLVSGTKGYICVETPWWKTQDFTVHYENSSLDEKFHSEFHGDGLRYEVREFQTAIKEKKENQSEESIALSEVMEQFLATRTTI